MADAACVACCSYEHPESAYAEEGEISVSGLHDSISFGRYMSESLEWGKWSSFRQNRHVEEAEKYSRPGSVAQKKAYFEEQHKKKLADQKAKALLEQANSVTSSGGPAEEAPDGGNHQLARSPVGATAIGGVLEVYANNDCTPKDCFSNEHDSEKQEIELQGLVMEDESIMVLPSRILSSSPPNSPPLEKETHRSRKSEEENIEVENQTPRESPSRIISAETIEEVEKRNAMAEAEPSRNIQPVKPPLQESSAANQEISASKEKKHKTLASKFSIFSRTSMASPPQPASPSHPKRENVSKLNKRSSNDMNERKAAPKSLHTSINLSSLKANENTLSVAINTQIDEKIGDSRPVISETSPRTSYRKSSMMASTKVSAAGVHKVVTFTPQSDYQSTKTQSPKAGHKNKKTNPMCQSVSTDCWKSSSSCWKRPSQVVCSPFRFRCEERAEKRKEFFLKLEEKLNAEKVQRQAKDKEMAENELKRLRQSLGFKARPLPDFYRKAEHKRTEPKKIPAAQAQASRFGRKVNPLEVSTANCLPPPVRSSTRKTERTPLKRAAGS